MRHVFFLINILVLMIAVGCSLMALFAYFKTRLEWVKHFTLALFSLFMILSSQTIESYLIVNSVDFYFVRSMDRMVGAIGCGICIYYLPRLGYSFFQKDINRSFKKFFLILALFQPLLYIAYELTSGNIILVAMSSLSLFLTFIHSLYTIYRLGKNSTPEKKAVVKSFLILMAISVPFILLDIFIEKIPVIGRHFPYGILSVPLFYLALNIMVFYHGFKNLKGYLLGAESDTSLADPAPPLAGSIENASSFYESFKITPREKEVIHLLLKGYSYNQICEELHVSLPTTKRHVYNIYQKTGVKNKIELLQRIQGSSY